MLRGTIHQRLTRSLVGLACGAAMAVTAAESAIDPAKLPPSATRAIDFENDVQPLFARHCVSCHGPEKQKADLRLDVKAKALASGAIVAGQSTESRLVHLVAGVLADEVMPPKGERLSAGEVGVLRAWIDQGAVWPDHLSATTQPTNFWAFQPLSRPPVPAMEGVSHPVDAFIAQKHAAHGLKHAAPADKATLLRRVTFDLIGLPPTPAELDAFLGDHSTNAFAKVVDRLLASPHYGERWARHWLDVARFCESDGFEYDKMREHAWRYRDYLVRSFNADIPYGRFIREQLAGDALGDVTHESIAATGFLVAGPYDEAGNSSASASLKARIREEELEDMIAGVSQTFLAMTANCARCHDHKFDPIPAHDYYRLQAALAGVRHGNRPLQSDLETRQREKQVAKLNARIAELEKQSRETEQSVRERVLRERSQGEATTNPVAIPPMARWTFDSDARDSVGALHASLFGGAKIENGRLVLNGKTAYARTETLASALRAKTLEAWVRLTDLKQRGGAPISIETKESGTFDAIVFGERIARKWLAGSSFYQRTRDLTAPDEDATPDRLVHVAVVHREDNSITVYRNGVPYGETFTPGGANSELRTYAPREARLLFGLRHTGAGNGFFAGEIEEARLYDRALSAEEILASARAMDANVITPEELTHAMTAAERQQRQARATEANELRKSLREMPPVEQVYAVVSRRPEPTHVLARGDIEKKREAVTAGGLSVLPLESDFVSDANEPEARRRVKLAEWIASTNNPITWRVMVNRVWHHHFGSGIVATPNDFGVNGERPTHPELLEWLASEFLTQGGSVKQLHRLILSSATYQQSSAVSEAAVLKVDAENRLLSRFPLRRLEAEAVRDAMLAISGELNAQVGGPSFRPFKVKVSGSHFYELFDAIGPEFNHRSIYRMNIQSGKDPLLDSLDCPDPSTKTPARTVTTTPIQSLGLMNNAFVHRRCSALARRLERETAGDHRAQIRWAYRLAFSREPRGDEWKEASTLVRAHGLESLCWVLFNASEFLYVR